MTYFHLECFPGFPQKGHRNSNQPHGGKYPCAQPVAAKGNPELHVWGEKVQNESETPRHTRKQRNEDWGSCQR